MSVIDPLPRVQTVGGLGQVFRKMGYSVISVFGGNLSGNATLNTVSNAYGQSTWNLRGLTYQQQELSATSVSEVILVHGNYANTGTAAGAVNSEMVPWNDVGLSSSLIDVANVGFYPVFWNGERRKRLTGNSIAISDPVAFPVTAGTIYATRTCGQPPSFDAKIPTVPGMGAAIAGVTNFPNSGATAEDATFATNLTMTAPNGNGMTHQMVLGFTGQNPAKSVALLLDSIMMGLGDVMINGGWGVRAIQQQFNLNPTQANMSTPYCGVTNMSKQGDTQANFLKSYQHQQRMKLISFHTSVIDNGGINDISTGATAATVMANTLATAKLITGMGVKYIKATILPVSASTDGWLTATNQTPTYLAVRSAVNDWLRDTSAAGFVQQAIAQGSSASLLGVYDPCAFVEVNTSNVLTTNGGCWKAPTGPAAFTGTVTTGGSASQIIDTSLIGVGNNLYRGYAFTPTSGANKGRTASVSGLTSSSGLLQFNTGFSSNFSAGDTYVLTGLNGVLCQDSTHPTTPGHVLIAQNFPLSLIA